MLFRKLDSTERVDAVPPMAITGSWLSMLFRKFYLTYWADTVSSIEMVNLIGQLLELIHAGPAGLYLIYYHRRELQVSLVLEKISSFLKRAASSMPRVRGM